MTYRLRAIVEANVRRVPRFAVAALVVTTLVACGQATSSEGVYVVSEVDGAPRWIGAPGGTPVWSPDGSAIAWGTEDGITVWDVSEGASRVLTTDAVAGRPAWSPDGDRIALVNRASGSLEVIDAETGTRLLETGVATPGARGRPNYVDLGGPSWSPDGQNIAFACWDGAGDEVCTIDGDGANRRQLTKQEPASTQEERAQSNAGPPSWSPDGQAIAVAAYPERRGAPAGVFVIDFARGSARRVSRLLPNSEIVWRSDSGALVFSAREDNRSDAFEILLDGDERTNLTDSLSSDARNPAIASGERRLAVASGGGIIVLENGNERAAFQTPGMVARTPAWNPAGDELAFVNRPDPIRTYN